MTDSHRLLARNSEPQTSSISKHPVPLAKPTAGIFSATDATSHSPQAGPRPARCRERGCVFPAEENAHGLCAYHERQRLEPALFSSWQPTWLLVHRSAAGVECAESTPSRSHDRRKLAAQFAAFQQGLA